MSKVVQSVFGGGRPKRDKRAEGLQRRQLQDAQNERSELEAERADVAGSARRRRSGRSLLSFAKSQLKKTTGS